MTEEDLWFTQVTVQMARDGHPEAARDLLQDYSAFLEEHPSPGFELYAQFIAEAIQRILHGEDPEKALGLKRRRGRPRGGVTFDESALAAAVVVLQRHNIPTERVVAELNQRLGADRSTIYTALRNHKAFASRDRFSDRKLSAYLQPYSEVVSDILQSN